MRYREAYHGWKINIIYFTYCFTSSFCVWISSESLLAICFNSDERLNCGPAKSAFDTSGAYSISVHDGMHEPQCVSSFCWTSSKIWNHLRYEIILTKYNKLHSVLTVYVWYTAIWSQAAQLDIGISYEKTFIIELYFSWNELITSEEVWPTIAVLDHQLNGAFGNASGSTIVRVIFQIVFFLNATPALCDRYLGHTFRAGGDCHL